jgi:hypothetical protein
MGHLWRQIPGGSSSKQCMGGRKTQNVPLDLVTIAEQPVALKASASDERELPIRPAVRRNRLQFDDPSG